MRRSTPVAALLTAAVLSVAPLVVRANDAADAPVTMSDLYAFRAADSPQTVTVIACVDPQEPSGGPLFPTFDPSALYAIHVDHDGDCAPDVTFELRFTTNIRFPFSPLFAVGSIQDLDGFGPNFEQLYSLTRVDGNGSTLLGEDIHVVPALVGPLTTPDYEALVAQAITDFPGVRALCGPRDVSFWVDAALFDLFSIRPGLPGTMGGGVDLRSGFNALSICLQVPIEELTSDGSVPTDPDDPAAILGIWATASRPEQTELFPDGPPVHSGPYVQVTRRGMPLVDELFIGMGEKDSFRGATPSEVAEFLARFEDPETAELLAAELGLAVPPPPRADLVEAYLSGLPDLNQVPGTQCDLLRLNVAIPPAAEEDPLGALAGDLAGFPNGRRPGDDVMDVILRWSAGALVPGYEESSMIGDGVDGNDAPILPSFPYLPSPSPGFEHAHHPTDSTTTTVEEHVLPGAIYGPVHKLLHGPNPVGGRLQITFDLARPVEVRLSFFDVLGRRLEETALGRLAPGAHRIAPRVDRWPSGTYFYVLEADGLTYSRRITVLE